jgi:3-oxoacyl-[acyl-carrier protein] reductase
MQTQWLSGKRAIIHGGTGAIGAAVAQVFVREGAQVFVTAGDSARLRRLASELPVHTTSLDVRDAEAVLAHAASVADGGGLDIMLNAVGAPHVQGVPFAELSLADFLFPSQFYLHVSFVLAQATARFMGAGGVILLLSPPGARLAGRGFIGSGAAFAGVEAFSRLLAAELGPSGVRVNCLRCHAIPESLEQGSHTRRIFERMAELHGTNTDGLLSERLPSSTLTGRLPTLQNVAEMAAFLGSARAAATTGAIANLTCGALVD